MSRLWRRTDWKWKIVQYSRIPDIYFGEKGVDWYYQPLDRLWAAQTQMHHSKTNGACCTRFAQFQLLARSHFQSIYFFKRKVLSKRLVFHRWTHILIYLRHLLQIPFLENHVKQTSQELRMLSSVQATLWLQVTNPKCHDQSFSNCQEKSTVSQNH